MEGIFLDIATFFIVLIAWTVYAYCPFGTFNYTSLFPVSANNYVSNGKKVYPWYFYLYTTSESRMICRERILQICGWIVGFLFVALGTVWIDIYYSPYGPVSIGEDDHDVPFISSWNYVMVLSMLFIAVFGCHYWYNCFVVGDYGVLAASFIFIFLFVWCEIVVAIAGVSIVVATTGIGFTAHTGTMLVLLCVLWVLITYFLILTLTCLTKFKTHLNEKVVMAPFTYFYLKNTSELVMQLGKKPKNSKQ